MGRQRPDTPSADRPIARHGRLHTSGPAGFLGKLAASIIGVVVVSALGIGTIAAADIVGGIKPGVAIIGQDGATKSITPEVAAAKGELNLLLVGSDTRAGQGAEYADIADQRASSGSGNNDVNILVHVSKNHDSATIVSFPRDLILPIPACPDGKGGSYSAMSAQMLNVTLSYGGLSCPILTIENLVGIKNINYAAEVNFAGVAAMSDAVGGVPVCIASRLYDPNFKPVLDLSPGTHVLKGVDALHFLRSRHGVDDGSDLARISNQQLFLSSLLRTVTKNGTLANPVKLYSLAKAATKNMTLSSTLEQPTTLVAIALALKGIPLNKIVLLQYPAVGDPSNPNRVIPDPSAAPALNSALQKDLPVTVSRTGRGTVIAPTKKPTAPASQSPSQTPSQTPTHSQTPSQSPSQTPSQSPSPSPTPIKIDTPGQHPDTVTCTVGVTGGRG